MCSKEDSALRQAVLASRQRVEQVTAQAQEAVVSGQAQRNLAEIKINRAEEEARATQAFFALESGTCAAGSNAQGARRRRAQDARAGRA